MVDRYENLECGIPCGLTPDENGSWVDYEDYRRLEDRVHTLELFASRVKMFLEMVDA